jgi:hypothetical protein
VSERYPREAAERLRAAQRGGAEHTVAQATADLSAAQDALARAQAELDAHRAQQPATPAAAQGPIDALELQRGAAFAQRHTERTRALRARVQQAQTRVAQCAAGVSAAQDALASAHAAERVIERDRARFESARRREREQAEQLEVEERIDRTRNEPG